MISTMIVDDDRICLASLRRVMTQANLNIVCEAYDGAEALEQLEKHDVDVVLMDIKMPVMDGIAATQRISESFPNVKVIALTVFEDDELVFQALQSGAVGYLLKGADCKSIATAVRLVASGSSFLNPTLTRKVIDRFRKLSPTSAPVVAEEVVDLSILTPRERQILLLISDGKSNAEIASELNIVEGTVKNNVSSILRKMNATNRTQAAMKARHVRMNITDNPYPKSLSSKDL